MGPDLHERMMALHDELATSFHAHQVALLDRDFVRAAAALARHHEQLLAHMHDEELLVLPRYRDLGGDATDAPVRLFLGEHGKLREFAADFVARVAALQAAPDDRRLLELFDRQATYKNLMLHHDLRERNMLYPFLAARLPAAEQGQILGARRWSGG